MNNNDIKPVDISEASLEELMKHFSNQRIAFRPTRMIVPPWVVLEIEAQFGAPATEEKYHRWNIQRLKLGDAEYWKRIGQEPPK